jgi:outer membrane protein OmpA-like peptidoglycan-associated protein
MLHKKQDNIWESISDLMTGLMIIFLFISIAFLARGEMIIKGYQNTQKDLIADLRREFSDDELSRWGAEISQDNASVVFFKPPVTFFEKNESNPTPQFQDILNNFFPRYMTLISSDKYKDRVVSIHIDGYASKEWGSNTSEDYAYFYNMKLSQDRARNVLSYIFSISSSVEEKRWLIEKVSANGYSYSKATGNHNESRRVEFVPEITVMKELEDFFK